jgi:hypothetical protein
MHSAESLARFLTTRRSTRPTRIGWALVALLTCPISSAVAQNTVVIADRAGPAVVTLKSYDSRGDAISQGSGFFVPDGRIVSNAHVVEGAARVEVFSAEGRLLGSVPHAEALSSEVDIVVLPRLGSTPSTVPLETRLPEVGEDVVVIGAPLGLANTVSTGIVSSVRAVRGVTLIQITAAISEGSSGGPVLNTAGAVVGVSVASLGDGQALNFAVPSRDVAALTASPPGRVPFPDPTGTAALQVADALQYDDDMEWLPVELRIGEAVTGRLDVNDPTLDDGSAFEYYEFSGAAGDRLVLQMRSQAFDAYLSVMALDTDWSQSDDDGGRGTDAELHVTLPHEGQYVVVANSLEPGEFGEYSLSVERATPTSLGAYSGSVTNSAMPDWPAPLRIEFESWTPSARGYLSIGMPLGGSGPVTAGFVSDSLVMMTVSETADTIFWHAPFEPDRLEGVYYISGGKQKGQSGSWQVTLESGSPLPDRRGR